MAIYTQSDFEKDKAQYGSAFDSLYERSEAMGSGDSVNPTAMRAALADRQRMDFLKGGGDPENDPSMFGTNQGLFNTQQYDTAVLNPLYRAVQPQNLRSYDTYQGSSDQEGAGGFFPSLAGPGPNRNPQGFLDTMAQVTPGMREAAGMGLANIASGGAFETDRNKQMQNFLDQGFSRDQAQRYITDTEQNLDRQRLARAMYGPEGRFTSGGTRATQETTATGDLDPTTDPNYIPPHLRYLMEQRKKGEIGIPPGEIGYPKMPGLKPLQTMNMGGIVALGPVMQQQQYEMGRQMAMGDMGKSV